MPFARPRAMSAALLVACYALVGQPVTAAFAAAPFLDDYPSRLEPPNQTNRFHKKERVKSSHEVRNDVYGEKGYVSSTKVTTENSSSREVSMDIPQSTYMHVPLSSRTTFSQDDYYFFAKAAGVGLAVIVVMIISTIACYRMQKNNKAAADIEYPAYGITGPNKDISPTGDRRLAQSAQMYHYQHQKQQIIAMETNSSSVKEGRCGSITDPDSDDDNEEGDYTVYECPGLAPAGEMEVKNPLFVDDNTPASPVVGRNNAARRPEPSKTFDDTAVDPYSTRIREFERFRMYRAR